MSVDRMMKQVCRCGENNMSLSLVVLAAGMGSRYGALKQLDPVGPSGEFIIDYSIYDAVRAGFDKIVFIIRKEFEADFKASIGSRVPHNIPVEYTYQSIPDVPGRTKPWGTGDALMTCRDVVSEPFGVINADDFYGAESYQVLASFLKETAQDAMKYCMVGFTLKNTLSEHGYVSRGICTADEQGLLQTVVERVKITRADIDAGGPDALTGNEIVSMNLWGFKPSLFEHLDSEFKRFLAETDDPAKAEFFIPIAVNNLVNDNKVSVSVLETSSTWFGVTYPEDKDITISRIRELVDAGVYPEKLEI